jgi:alpha-ketoglutarate-dependent taurine dioxygenase
MIERIENKTITDIYDNIDIYVDKFLDSGILFFKNINLSTDDQLKLFDTLGSKVGFRSENKINIEDHQNTFNRYTNAISEDEIFIEWHIENIHKEDPQVAASWSMINYDCSSSSGRTVCVNMSDFYLGLPDEWKSFLNNLTININIGNDDNGVVIVNENFENKNIKPVVINHYATKKPTLRIPLYAEDYEPYMYDNSPLGDDQKNIFLQIQNYIEKQITYNKDIVDCISWEKGDLVIIDLFTTAHAVYGGFNLGERTFSRIWGYNISE